MSETDIKRKIENILSGILSDKYECKIIVKFGGPNDEISNESKTIY